METIKNSKIGIHVGAWLWSMTTGFGYSLACMPAMSNSATEVTYTAIVGL